VAVAVLGKMFLVQQREVRVVEVRVAHKQVQLPPLPELQTLVAVAVVVNFLLPVQEDLAL
jgi:hypothetical protein